MKKNRHSTWNDLEKAIYYKDGSLRDIYIHNTTEDDWRLWIRHVNSNYSIKWFNGITQLEEGQINEQIVIDYLNRKHDLCSSASIFLGKIQVNCHFFDLSEIEKDISPKEFTCTEDHNILIEYLTDLSSLLGREAILTPDNMPETALLKVNKTNVNILG